MHTSSMHILFAIEHGKGDQVFKLEKMYHFKKILAHLEFQSSNMSQKLGTGSFLVLCNACSLNNSLSGNWGGMLLYIPWYRILAAQHLRFFCLMIFQMFSVGEKSELQSGQFNTQNFLQQTYVAVIDAVSSLVLFCWNMQQKQHSGGSICFSKTCIYLSALMPIWMCKLPVPGIGAPPYYLRCRLFNWALITSQIVHLLFCLEDVVLFVWLKQLKMSIFLWAWKS